MFETCRGLWFSINWMKNALRWFHYTDILWYTVSKTLSLNVLRFIQNWKSDIFTNISKDVSTVAVFVFRWDILWNIKFLDSGHTYKVRGKDFSAWKLGNSNEDQMYIY
jgi:hypothetical protein